MNTAKNSVIIVGVQTFWATLIIFTCYNFITITNTDS